jgi:hypothetical protein
VGTLLIRRRRPIGETSAAGFAATYDGIAGAGRIVQSLAELGVVLDTVHQLVLDPEAPPGDLDGIETDARFPLVVLGSHLVNLTDEAARRSFLALARRHLAPEGTVLIEHHPLDWAETAAETRPTPGSTVGMIKVRRDPPFVSAVSIYDVGGRWFEQPFTARVMSEAELAEELAAAGLFVRRRLGPTWLVAGPVAPHSWPVQPLHD